MGARAISVVAPSFPAPPAGRLSSTSRAVALPEAVLTSGGVGAALGAQTTVLEASFHELEIRG